MSAPVFCQNSKPDVAERIVSPFVLKFKPGFDSLCTKKEKKKNKGDWFWSETEKVFLEKTIYESGTAKHILDISEGQFAIKIIRTIEQSGAASETEPKIETNLPENDETKPILGLLKKAFSENTFHGKSAISGDVLKNDLCGKIGGSRVGSDDGGIKLEGYVSYGGRKAVLFTSTSNMSCYVSGKNLKMDFNGWYVFDIESGLMLSNVFDNNRIYFGNEVVAEGSEVTSCELKANNSYSSQKNEVTSKEKELSEAKNLFDKGLIDQDSYNKVMKKIMGI